MASRKHTPPPVEVEHAKPRSVVRRGREPQKPLPPHLDAFARGDDDALWRREQRGGRVHDPRPVVLVPGVKNADARLVAEARITRLRATIAQGDERALARALAEATALGVWRGLNVVSFDAFSEAVLGVAFDRARALATSGAVELGLPEQLSEADIAVWMRAEAGMLEASAEGAVSYREGRLVIEVPIAQAAEALAAAGRREAPMTKLPTGPQAVYDRPAGVPSMRTILERERRAREDE